VGIAWGSSEAKAPFGRGRDRFDAPCLFDVPINGEAVLAHAQTILGPTLKPGDMVIIDNLGGHRGKAVRQAVRQSGAKPLFQGSRPI